MQPITKKHQMTQGVVWIGVGLPILSTLMQLSDPPPILKLLKCTHKNFLLTKLKMVLQLYQRT